MTALDGLAIWLREQLDEDERIAKAATPGPWRYDPSKHWRGPDGWLDPDGNEWAEEAVFALKGDETLCVALTGASDDPPSMTDAEYIAAHDPARTLVDIAAKREIVEDWIATDFARQCHPNDDPYITGSAEAMDFVLRRLGLPYADRPGYLDQWRPA